MEKYFVPAEIYLLLLDSGYSEPLLFCESENTIVAAPLYHQVFDWLESRDIRIHDLYIFFEKKRWCAHVYCMKTGKMLWGPVMNESSTIDFSAYQHADKRDAWNTAIIEALKLINKNEDDREAKERPGKGKEDAPQL